MVWTQIETDFFFRYATQMGLSIPVQDAIQIEVIIEVDDLLDFDDDQWKMFVSNLKNPTSIMGVARPNAHLSQVEVYVMPLGKYPYQYWRLQAKWVATMIILVEPLDLSTWLGLPCPT